MIVVAAVIVALACVLASARRLSVVTAPTALHPDDVVSLADLQGPGEGEWEHELFDALSVSSPAARAALVNEQLTELDLRLKEWERVPRVCASISTSAGILLGTLVLRKGLAEAPDLSGELGELFVRSVLGDAISVACFGIVGTTFCIAANSQAKRLAKARLEASDRMVERLEALAGGAT